MPSKSASLRMRAARRDETRGFCHAPLAPFFGSRSAGISRGRLCVRTAVDAALAVAPAAAGALATATAAVDSARYIRSNANPCRGARGGPCGWQRRQQGAQFPAISLRSALCRRRAIDLRQRWREVQADAN